MTLATARNRKNRCLENAKINRADPELRRRDVEQAWYYRQLYRSMCV